jgi:hypothetical protein
LLLLMLMLLLLLTVLKRRLYRDLFWMSGRLAAVAFAASKKGWKILTFRSIWLFPLKILVSNSEKPRQCVHILLARWTVVET